jgi:hypothetical protein
MNRKTLEISISYDSLTWLENYAKARKIPDLALAVESLINMRRAEVGTGEFTEPHGQALVRDALGKSLTVPLTVSQLVDRTGLSVITVRQYTRKLEGLGHLKGGHFVKRSTNYAEAFKLTSPGRRVWLRTIRDPEERTAAELTVEDLESKGE